MTTDLTRGNIRSQLIALALPMLREMTSRHHRKGGTSHA